jgi:hypothetical protein
MAGHSDAMKPERFGDGENFHCWQNKVKFWLMSLGLWWVIHPMMPLTVPQAAANPTAHDSALGCILTLLENNLYDIYMDYKDPTQLWDALECKYAIFEDGHLLYICEQLFDFSINAAKSIVMQAHEFQLLAREIASLGCPTPDRVVAAGIIAKLPTSWRDFATCLKHKREDISIESLITTLDVEEKARAKDAPSTSAAVENGASANVVVGKNNPNNKNKGKMQDGGKLKKTTNFKKNTRKDNRACFVCGKGGHLVKDCHHRKTQIGGQQKKVVNMTIGKNNGDEADPFGYGNLPSVFSPIQSTNWWVDTGANVHVCSDLSFLPGDVVFFHLDGKRICGFFSWCWYGRTEAHFREDYPFEERVACSNNKQEYH